VEQFAAEELSRAEICRGFGVSRKTGYKWFEQYRLEGVAGLAPQAILRFKRREQGAEGGRAGAILARLAGLFREVRKPTVWQSLGEWTRRRLRSVIWKQWKRGDGGLRSRINGA
jgi:transposase